MGGSERVVHHLRVSASEAQMARALLPRLEDALRCASLPDCGASLLLVRKLDLGRVPGAATSQQLSMQIEQRLARIGLEVIDGGADDAVHATAVAFVSPLHARIALTVRLLRSLRCEAWYWQLAVREFDRAGDMQTNLARIGHTIAAWPEAAVAWPTWARQVEAQMSIDFASLLSGADFQVAAGAVSRPAPRREVAAPSEIEPLAATEAAASGVLAAALWRLAAADGTTRAGRSEKLEFVRDPVPGAGAGHATGQDAGAREALLSPGDDARGSIKATAQPEPPVGIAFQSAPFVARPTDVGSPSRRPTPPTALSAPGTAERQAVAHQARRLAHLPADLHCRASPAGGSVMLAATASSERAALSSHAVRSPLRSPPRGALSACGGTLFLLPVLSRLGLPAWLAGRDDAPAFAAAVLQAALERLAVPIEEPAWQLATPVGPSLSGVVDRSAPAIWADAALAPVVGRGARLPQLMLADALAQAADPATQAALWLTACRRWLRRVGGIGLASLVLRPGGLALTATHADVHFDLADTDRRVRRLGLDLDPGWLPWAGRVVAFHFHRSGDGLR